MCGVTFLKITRIGKTRAYVKLSVTGAVAIVNTNESLTKLLMSTWRDVCETQEQELNLILKD
jgi:hypothetical protein